MSEGPHICAHCHTELAAAALVCDACGMTRSVPAPPRGEMPRPALRPPPEPPAVTAPTLLPAPEPPPAGSSVLSGRNPLASGAFPAAEQPPEMRAGDPLAGKPPVVPFAAPAEPPPAAPPAPGEPETSPPPAEPPAAHPFDETPPGYVTAASLWKISAPPPDWSAGESGAEQTQPEAAAHAQAASVASHTPA